jgi:hypothetical protein
MRTGACPGRSPEARRRAPGCPGQPFEPFLCGRPDGDARRAADELPGDPVAGRLDHPPLSGSARRGSGAILLPRRVSTDVVGRPRRGLREDSAFSSSRELVGKHPLALRH